MKYARELETAIRLAKEAGEIQLHHRHLAVKVSLKEDASPVSEVDQACERHIREGLAVSYPDDDILGEEEGGNAQIAGRHWIIDPIDGTRPYLRGIPTFSVLLSLEEDGVPVVGVIHLPALGETYAAAKGAAATLNGHPIQSSRTEHLRKAMGSQLGFFERHGEKDSEAVKRVMLAADYGYGFMDAYTYGSVAAGRLDFAVNLLDKPWDCSAACCIVEAAGGSWSDLQGRRSTRNGQILLTNGLLHDEILEILQSAFTNR